MADYKGNNGNKRYQRDRYEGKKEGSYRSSEKKEYRSFDKEGKRKDYQDKPSYSRNYRSDKKEYGKEFGKREEVYEYRKGENNSYKGKKEKYPVKPYEKKEGYSSRSYEKKESFEEKKSYEKSKAYAERVEEKKNEKEEEEDLPNLVIGRNAVREAVKSGRSIDRLLVSKEPDGSLKEIIGLARDRGIVIREVEKKKIDEITIPFGYNNKPANHQGIIAYAAGVEYVEISDIMMKAADKKEDPFIIVLDGIMDPHNLGSIIRSADCAGVHGVIIGKRRCASVSAAAVKTAAGAVEHVPVAKVTNITAALKELKEAGVWIAGADMEGEEMEKANMKGPLALVIGNEGEGLSEIVRKNCDFMVSIPMTGHIGSLNASVAAAILMFEKRRQDKK